MVKIALLGNVNMDLFVPKLKELLSDEGIDNEFYVSGYNQYVQDLINPASTFNQDKFDIAIVFIDGEEYFNDLINDSLTYSSLNASNITERIEAFVSQINAASSNCNTTFLLNTILIRKPTILGAMDKKHNNSPSDMQRLFNEHINILCTNKKIIIVDFEGFVARHGHENIYDDRLWYLARMKFDKEILELLATMYRDYICAFLERNKKIIVLDLDNTLYGGVIGEDGIDGIAIGNDGVGKIYCDFQRLIRILKERGVLLAICSKNNYSDVKEVFLNHPSMVLKEEDFIDMRINWNDKVGNLKEIANRLNLGLDSFVFLDDNPFERELIKSKLPQVTVPDFPADHANLCRWLIDISFRYFNKVTITDEDKSRFDMYKSEFERKNLSKVATDLDDFYRSLKMEATITYNNNNYINRISQLTQRTNQFNLTTPRYSENQIAWFMNNKNNFVFSLELNDRFGSSGIVGVSILKIDANVAYIDTLLLSCRVVGRTVENAFIAYMLNFLRKKGIKYIVGEYIPTKKNSLVADLYKKIGFDPCESDNNGKYKYKLTITKSCLSIPDWISVNNK